MIPYLLHDNWQPSKVCYLWGLDDAAAASIIGSAVASTASAGISAATAGKTNARGSRLAHRQHEWAIQDAKMQREWALEDWNRNAEYNSPSAVIQRYKDAGLNPMAAITNGNVSSEAPTMAAPNSVAMPSAPHFINPLGDMPQIINSATNAVSALFQNRKTQAETNNIKSDTEKKIEETQRLRIANMYADQLEQGNLKFLGLNCEFTAAKTETEKENCKKVGMEIANLQQDLENKRLQCLDLGADISLKQFQLYAERMKLPVQLKRDSALALLYMQQQYSEEYLRLDKRDLLQSQTRGNNINARMQEAYFGNGQDGSFWKAHQQNINFTEKYQAYSSKNDYESNRKTGMLRTVDKVSDSIGRVVLPVNHVLQGFMTYQIGKSQQLQRSSPNPVSQPHQFNPYINESAWGF